MNAFLDATGERENLYPLTAHYAPPMLPVGNRPAIAYAVELLVRYQVRDIVVGLHRRADCIEAYCDTGRRWNANFTYLLQREALGTAGAVKRAQNLLEDTLLVMPGDALVDVRLDALCEFHKAHKGMATAVVARQRGYAENMAAAQMDAGCRLQRVEADGTRPDGYCFTGVFLLEREILELIPSQAPFDLATDLLPRLISEDQAVYGYILHGYWNPLDSFASYHAAQQDFLRSLRRHSGGADTDPTLLRHAYAEAARVDESIWRGSDVKIHPSAKIAAPALIGAGSQIGRDAAIGGNVTIGPGCIVDEGATIEASTILPNTYVGKLVKIHNKVVSGGLLIDIDSQASVELADWRLLGSAGTQTANALLRSALERALATGLAILLAPLLIGLGLMVWLSDFGPVLTRTTCVGRSPRHAARNDGDPPTTIVLYRLRTRLPDGGCTSIGRSLERWELHRLPELLNVAMGDMALVGVKPLTLKDAGRITEEWQRRRFECPAGFTGRWYTETEAGADLDELLVADAYQTAVWSTQDLWQQLARTPAAWRRRHRFSHMRADPREASSLVTDHSLSLLDDSRTK